MITSIFISKLSQHNTDITEERNMLQEIFKGMPNASEAIDENFKKLDTSINGDESEGFIKLENGLAVCWAEGVPQNTNHRVVSSSNTYRTQNPSEWILPINFTHLIYAGVFVSNSNRWGSATLNDDGNIDYVQHQGNSNDSLIPSRLVALVMYE